MMVFRDANSLALSKQTDSDEISFPTIRHTEKRKYLRSVSRILQGESQINSLS